MNFWTVDNFRVTSSGPELNKTGSLKTSFREEIHDGPMGGTWTMRIFHVTIIPARNHHLLHYHVSGSPIFCMSDNSSIERPQIPWTEGSWWQRWNIFICPITWNFSQWGWFSYCHCWMFKMIAETDIGPQNSTIILATWRLSFILDYFQLGGSSNLSLLGLTYTPDEGLPSLFTVSIPASESVAFKHPLYQRGIIQILPGTNA